MRCWQPCRYQLIILFVVINVYCHTFTFSYIACTVRVVTEKWGGVFFSIFLRYFYHLIECQQGHAKDLVFNKQEKNLQGTLS